MINKEITEVSLTFPKIDISNLEELQKILSKMKQEFEEDENLHALSAPLIDEYYRIITLKFTDGFRTMINPVYTQREGQIISREKFLDETQEYLIPRFKEVTVMFTRTNGEIEEVTLKDAASCLFQQMYDTLDCVKLCDYGLAIDNDFDELSDEKKNEVYASYLESIAKYLKELKSDIYSDDTLRAQQNAIDFSMSVARGDTKLVEFKPNRATRRANKRNRNRTAKMFGDL